MNYWEAALMGLLQGLTEFLPVSSSGHLELSRVILGVESSDNLFFTLVVHVATCLSTIIIFRKDISNIFTGLFERTWNQSHSYLLNIVVSMVPIFFVGLLFEKEVESYFFGNITLVGIMLCFTALLLSFTFFFKPQPGKLGPAKAMIIGVAQALAIAPGISRSGATIATGLLLGIDKEEVTKFSFLMVLAPILGAMILKILDIVKADQVDSIGMGPLSIGFLAAFFAGLVACQWMIKIVKQGKLIYFAIYCLIIGLLAIFGFVG